MDIMVFSANREAEVNKHEDKLKMYDNINIIQNLYLGDITLEYLFNKIGYTFLRWN